MTGSTIGHRGSRRCGTSAGRTSWTSCTRPTRSPTASRRTAPRSAALKASHQAFCQAFPDLHVDVVDVIQDGARMAIHFVASGTHTAPGLPMPPSGQRITVRGMVFARHQDGRFVEAWNLYDRLSLLTQIGRLPMQAI